MQKKIRVLIVDDSALIRSILREIIDSQPDMTAVGAASNPFQAREMIKALNPDVLTLDIEMPQMDGLTFLEKLMRLRPMPVLMISTLTGKGSEAALRALELGAVDYLPKPRLGIEEGMKAYSDHIAARIRAASLAKLKTAGAAPRPLPAFGRTSTEKLVAIGASTGGTEALKEVLIPLPADAPAVLVTQHMPEAFTKSFAARLDTLCRMSVKEAEHAERVLPGHVYVAPGNAHMLLERSGANYVIALDHSAPYNHHRPAVDKLFFSVARGAGKNAVGILLTGMGRDGADGMLEMHRSGAYNIAQDESSSVVYGMPRAAVETGAADEVLPLGEIAPRLLELFGNGQHSRI